MKYAVPQFSPSIVNAAGRALKEGYAWTPSGEDVLAVVNNWRASHNHVLMVFYVNMVARARKIWPNAIPSQRIKRRESIVGKLFRQPTMNLSQMQDIGGCRVVMRNVGQVHELLAVYKQRPTVHKLVGSKDYIWTPKPDGYRGVHLIYRYEGNGPKAVYTGQRIEIQIRTRLQHIWATAVEAAGTFTKQALKSNQGRQEWLRFFACMSSYFAIREGCPPVPGTPSTVDELRKEITELNRQLHVVTVLQSYSVTARSMNDQKGWKYILMQLDPHAKQVNLRKFSENESETANLAYTDLEKTLAAKPDAQAVLVSVESIKALRRAYPNYFLDTTLFVREVEDLINPAPAARWKQAPVRPKAQ